MLLIRIFDLVFEIYWWILMARFLLSWLPQVDYYHPVVKFIHKVTEPLVRLFSGIVPPMGSVDFSPLFLFLALRLLYPLVRDLLVNIVFRVGLF